MSRKWQSRLRAAKSHLTSAVQSVDDGRGSEIDRVFISEEMTAAERRIAEARELLMREGVKR